MTVVGLDACMQCPFTREDMERAFKNNETPVTRFALDITGMYMDFYRINEEFHGCYLHDPLAVGVAIWPDLITHSELHNVEVITSEGSTQGMTIIDRRPRNPWLNRICMDAYKSTPNSSAEVLRNFGLLKMPPHVEIVLDVNSREFLKRFLEVCFP